MTMSKNEKFEGQSRRCNKWQSKYLKLCSREGDKGITRFNDWHRKHFNKEIELEGEDFSHLYLKGIELGWGHPGDPKRHVIRLGYFGKVYLKGTGFTASNLQSASFSLANLEDTSFVDARLEGAHFEKCNLKKASFLHATVDGATLFWECEINKYRRKGDFTDFSGVALDSTRIDHSTKQLLEYNIRRKNWDKWFRGENAKKQFGKIETKPERWIRKGRTTARLVLTLPIRWFLSISSYGIRTWPIAVWFIVFAYVFALLYWLWPNTVMVNCCVGDIRGFWHALYFSVVTMTTLGFGDIAANPDSWAGQTLLMIQVILGYVLLGALVTRFAVLFTAGGPAGKFADEKEKEDEKK
jgi:uncharacterized protein YjbI with pentapeptide repeats